MVPLAIPIFNLVIYCKIWHVLSRSPHTKAANPLTFNGAAGRLENNPKTVAKSGKTTPLPADKGAPVNKKGSSTDFPVLRQFFRTPAETPAAPPGKDEGKPKKAKLQVNTGLVHEDVVDYLKVYADPIACPWALHGKSFTCGYTKEFLMWKSLKETYWMVPKKVWNDSAIAAIVKEHGGPGGKKKKNN